MLVLVNALLISVVLGAAYAMVKASANYDDFKDYLKNKNN